MYNSTYFKKDVTLLQNLMQFFQLLYQKANIIKFPDVSTMSSKNNQNAITEAEKLLDKEATVVANDNADASNSPKNEKSPVKKLMTTSSTMNKNKLPNSVASNRKDARKCNVLFCEV